MSDPYIGQIEAFPYGFAPKDWAVCQGQTMEIAQNQALFSLLGTTYGGNGTITFQLPNLQGNVAMGQGSGGGLTPRLMGQTMGEANHTLLTTEIPAHSHSLNGTTAAATSNIPDPTVTLGAASALTGTVPGGLTLYAPAAGNPATALSAAAVGQNGGNQPHTNMMPYLGLQFCIALTGIYPSQN